MKGALTARLLLNLMTPASVNFNEHELPPVDDPAARLQRRRDLERQLARDPQNRLIQLECLKLRNRP